ncbi:MAG TPA: nitrate- and nitrite sensing domain-containing protein [Acidimicrobiales bacterium]|nr:nitrate- and nitrite sensing domain-containing protein [Acidimicrobiales bacterium]
MLQRFPIRVKLAIALAVPLLALLVVAVFEAVSTSGAAGEIREQADLATAAIGVESVPSKLEDERNAAAIYLVGLENIPDLMVEDNTEARAATDQALEEFRGELASRSDAAEEAYGPALEAMGPGLDALRQQVDAYQGERRPENIDLTREVFDGYSELMSPLFDTNRQVALEVDDPELRRGAQLIDLAARQTDLMAKLTIAVFFANGGGEQPDNLVSSSQEVAEVSALYAELTDNSQSIDTKAAGGYRKFQQDLAATPHLQTFNEMVERGLTEGIAPPAELLSAAAGPSAEENGYSIFRRQVGEELQSEANSLTDNADVDKWLFGALALASLLIAGLATWWVSRSITRPLRALTRQATDMANHRLPDAVLDILDTPLGDDVTVPQVEPISVQTRDEVADVADALNTVQDSALDLAVEQAVLRRNIADSFVNLGRRNQNLLGRQLDFITELEHNETDPDTLANLFRLDHLATRMRRNAESLLVLAGIDPPRKWAAPVRVTDAIRAALGEVEDYQRVTVRAVEATTVMGSAAADLAHLLAELIENALIFSPPDQTVEIRGRTQPAGYTLAIIDSGLGMPPEELARANRRLAGAESFTIAPSKYLGHYVAGNLAARHNINVTLHNSPGHGITATINLPPPLLTAEPNTGQLDTAPGAPNLTSTPTLMARRDLTSQQAIAGLAPVGSPASGGDRVAEPLAIPAAHSSDNHSSDNHAPVAPLPTLMPLDPGPLTPLPPAPVLPAARAPQSPQPPMPGPLQPPTPPQGPTSPPPPPSPLFPPLPATGTNDLQLAPLPPPVDPGQLHETQPMFTIEGARQQYEADPTHDTSGPAPLPSGANSQELPLLSAPHLRVSAPQATPPPPQARPPAAPVPAPGPTAFPPAPSGNPPPLTQRGGPRAADIGPGRTSGGLVKRSPRQGSIGTGLGSGSGGGSTQPARPSDDLLQTLATYTTHLHRQINPSRPLTPPGGGPGAFPAFNPTPPPGTPAVRTGGGPGQAPRQPGLGAPTTHPSPSDHTASGLARRVAGAQMPQTQPVGLRRQQQPPPPPPSAPQPRAAAPSHNQDHRRGNDGTRPPRDVTSSDTQRDPRTAKDVYGFLSSFSAGVQRGLDEARNPTTSEEDQ